jgi:hypothetical protein
MQFESQNKRNWILNAFIGFVPDVVIALVLAHFFKFEGWGVLFAVVALNVVYLLVWSRNSIWQWIYFNWRGKKMMVEHLYDYLKSNDYPCPNDFESSPMSYLSSVADSEEVPLQTRLLAAKELGALDYPASMFKMQEGMRMTMAYEEAIRRYKTYCEIRGKQSF